jgi:general secretion pathway protein B
VSYILDALKKAERDRRSRRAPTLGTIHGEAPAMRRRLWFWIAAGIVLLNVVTLVVLFRVNALDGRRPAVAPASAPAPAVSAPIVPVTNRPGVAATAGAKGGLDIPRDAPTSPLPARPKDDERPPRDDTVRRDASAAESARESSAGHAGAPRWRDPTGEAPRTTMATDRALDTGRPAGTVGRVAGSDLRLEVLVYADDPGERSAWIDGQRYVEGQRVHGRFTVDKISPDGVLLSGEGRRMVLRQ